MRIALNLLSFRPGYLGGGETFMRELTIGLLDVVAKGDSVIIISNGQRDDWIPQRAERLRLGLWTTRPVERVLREQLVLPWALRRNKIDVLIMPTNAALRLLGLPQLVVVHDLSAKFYKDHYPRAASRWRQAYVLWSNRQAARRAACIVAPSEFSRSEITRHLNAEPESIVVVPYAGSHMTRMNSPPGNPDLDVLKRRQLSPNSYLLTVASKSKHKNLERLISAWSLVRTAPGLESLQLVLVGQPGYGYTDIAEAAAEVPSVVMIDDHLSDADLDVIYRNASAFVLPSLYEGWGLPVLEAMARGIPVACSSAGSLPEVAGDAAVLFDPLDENAMAGAIVRVLNDPAARHTCIQRGLERASGFTWESTASAILEAARCVVDGGQ